jgi:hypothetical protein
MKEGTEGKGKEREVKGKGREGEGKGRERERKVKEREREKEERDNFKLIFPQLGLQSPPSPSGHPNSELLQRRNFPLEGSPLVTVHGLPPRQQDRARQ